MASELHEYWCAILGLNQSVLTGSLTRQSEGILTTSLTFCSPVPFGRFQVGEEEG